jgi:hypothetical protein
LDNFIRKQSTFELNLSNETRSVLIYETEVLLSENKEIPKDHFDSVLKSVLMDIKTGNFECLIFLKDIFPRFCLSSYFKELLQRLDSETISTFENIRLEDFVIN